MRGFILIVFLIVVVYEEVDLEKVKFFILLVYGEKDVVFELYVDKLKKILDSEVFMMKNVCYFCYFDNYEEFYWKVF